MSTRFKLSDQPLRRYHDADRIMQSLCNPTEISFRYGEKPAIWMCFRTTIMRVDGTYQEFYALILKRWNSFNDGMSYWVFLADAYRVDTAMKFPEAAVETYLEIFYQKAYDDVKDSILHLYEDGSLTVRDWDEALMGDMEVI